MKIVAVYTGNTAFSTVGTEVDCPKKIRHKESIIPFEIADEQRRIERPVLPFDVEDLSDRSVPSRYHAGAIGFGLVMEVSNA